MLPWIFCHVSQEMRIYTRKHYAQKQTGNMYKYSYYFWEPNVSWKILNWSESHSFGEIIVKINKFKKQVFQEIKL